VGESVSGGEKVRVFADQGKCSLNSHFKYIIPRSLNKLREEFKKRSMGRGMTTQTS